MSYGVDMLSDDQLHEMRLRGLSATARGEAEAELKRRERDRLDAANARAERAALAAAEARMSPLNRSQRRALAAQRRGPRP